MIANKRIAAVWRANLLRLCCVNTQEDINENPWVLNYVNLLDVGIKLFNAKYHSEKILNPEFILAELEIKKLISNIVDRRTHRPNYVAGYFASVSDLSEAEVSRIFKDWFESDYAPRVLNSCSRSSILGRQIADLPHILLVLREAMTPQIEHSLEGDCDGQ